MKIFLTENNLSIGKTYIKPAGPDLDDLGVWLSMVDLALMNDHFYCRRKNDSMILHRISACDVNIINQLPFSSIDTLVLDPRAGVFAVQLPTILCF